MEFEANKQNHLTFIPNSLPPVISCDKDLIALLVRAERKVGELKGKGGELENPHILTRAYIKREAVLSSKIEGTLASLEDLNRHEVIGEIGKNTSENLRLYEVLNYIRALEDASNKIKNPDQSIDLNIMKDSNKTLMNKVRGQDKNPGEFRTRQNRIVKTTGTVPEIVYTPRRRKKCWNCLKILKFLSKQTVVRFQG